MKYSLHSFVLFAVKVPVIHKVPVEIEQHTPYHVHRPLHYSAKEYVPVVEDHHHGHHHEEEHEHHFDHY